MLQQILLLDVETYPNFFFALLKCVEDGRVYRFQLSPSTRLDTGGLLGLLSRNLLISFNGREFDLPLLQLALRGFSAAELKEAADYIIGGMRRSDFQQQYGLSDPPWNHIDLINVAPLKASLKMYGARLHCPKTQDLPFDPSKEVTAEQAIQIKQYCLNDVETLGLLYDELLPQIELRRKLSQQYRRDVRSLSDAQVAEAVICEELQRITGTRPRRPENVAKQFKYQVPEYISYRHPTLQAMLERVRSAEFVVQGNGSVAMPAGFDQAVRFGGSTYRMGIGGLHSSEVQVNYHASEDVLLIDRDVTSYYPSIILGQGLYPKHLGSAFLTVYRSLVERRIQAKRDKDVVGAESLKIAVNGSFGKLGSMWSALYAPDLMIQVTVTGQLCLLMLIEAIEMEVGAEVLSANTDGVLIRCDAYLYESLSKCITRWEQRTGFGTEETRYRGYHGKDVNNYLAIKEDGSVKGKGLYNNPWEKAGRNVFKLHKNPTCTVVIEAVVALLRDGTPIEHTIEQCQDVRKFVSVRAVTGGANEADGDYVGKTVRWYYARDAMAYNMRYRKSGNKVPKSEGSKPLMELPATLPDDINYNRYVMEARAMLADLGYAQRRLF